MIHYVLYIWIRSARYNYNMFWGSGVSLLHNLLHGWLNFDTLHKQFLKAGVLILYKCRQLCRQQEEFKIKFLKHSGLSDWSDWVLGRLAQLKIDGGMQESNLEVKVRLDC